MKLLDETIGVAFVVYSFSLVDRVDASHKTSADVFYVSIYPYTQLRTKYFTIRPLHGPLVPLRDCFPSPLLLAP
jgi:hypothetical protein